MTYALDANVRALAEAWGRAQGETDDRVAEAERQAAAALLVAQQAESAAQADADRAEEAVTEAQTIVNNVGAQAAVIAGEAAGNVIAVAEASASRAADAADAAEAAATAADDVRAQVAEDADRAEDARAAAEAAAASAGGIRIGTQAQFEDAASAVNGTGKAPGIPGFDTTRTLPLWATGAAPTAAWVRSDGTVAAQPDAQGAPEMLTPASFNGPAYPVAGDLLTIVRATFSGATPVGVLTLDGVDVTSQVVGGQYTATGPGVLVWTDTATNLSGTATSTATLTVHVPLASIAHIYADFAADYPGTDQPVTSLTLGGTLGPRTMTPIGSGTAPQWTPDGVLFAAGTRPRWTGTTVPSYDGALIAMEVLRTEGGTGGSWLTLDSGADQMAVVRQVAGAWQVLGVGAAYAAETPLRPITEWRWVVAEIDYRAGRVRIMSEDGYISMTPVTGYVPINLNQIELGNGARGTLRELAVMLRPPGEAYPGGLSLVSLYERLGGQGYTAAKNEVLDYPLATGQSNSLGHNPGTATAPDGRTWRVVCGAADPRYLVQPVGLIRSDGVTINQIDNPLLSGYQPGTTTTTTRPMTISASVCEGAVFANEMIYEGAADAPMWFQFPGAGGQGIEVFDNDLPAVTGINGTVLYNNVETNLEVLAATAAAQGRTPRVPYLVLNTGEADTQRPRGWWLPHFREFHADLMEQMERLIGQTEAPKLILRQIGGYADNVGRPNDPCLDQIDVAVEYDGLLVPGYPYILDNSDNAGIHLAMVSHYEASATGAWAAREDRAGRAWNILPPAVSRDGGTITLTFALRPGETLVSEDGKYAAYGGDPAHYGLAAMGGGAITGATISGATVTLTTTGTVTGISYARQVQLTKQYAVNGEVYPAQRGLLRGSDTLPITRGGQAMTLRRWVPAFEVAA